jgi:2',3'-cyclic-nucleotide 2'-phosphodiesterase (5'-nucleotidase family)
MIVQNGDVEWVGAATRIVRNIGVAQRPDVKAIVDDAMRLKYPGVDAAYTNSGGLRADLNCSPPSAGEQPCEITWGEMFSVLPFGTRL